MVIIPEWWTDSYVKEVAEKTSFPEDLIPSLRSGPYSPPCVGPPEILGFGIKLRLEDLKVSFCQLLNCEVTSDEVIEEALNRLLSQRKQYLLKKGRC
jgi:hypothetical protein